MFVSKKKLKALVDENMALKKENRNLKATNERLFDNNLDLWWDNKMLRFRASVEKQQTPHQATGRYFYTKQKETKI